METFTRGLVAEQRVYGWLRDVYIDAEGREAERRRIRKGC